MRNGSPHSQDRMTLDAALKQFTPCMALKHALSSLIGRSPELQNSHRRNYEHKLRYLEKEKADHSWEKNLACVQDGRKFQWTLLERRLHHGDFSSHDATP